jgi:hypothetical protein
VAAGPRSSQPGVTATSEHPTNDQPSLGNPTPAKLWWARQGVKQEST